MASLTLTNIVKRYGTTTIIHDVDLAIADGEFVVFVGPSGCGKSTLLRMISGLESVTTGDLLIDGKRVNDVSAAQRGLAMVFQSYALYPHMTVYQNLAFGLENLRAPRAEIETKVHSAARMLKLDTLLDRRPTQLSGGQRQRVAIGRCDRPRPDHLPVRRAAVEPRRGVARADAHGDHRSARPLGHHDGLRHPRPGGGDDHGRQDRRAARGSHRAGRLAARALQQSAQSFRRRLHRFAANEFPRRERRGPWARRRACRPCRWRRRLGRGDTGQRRWRAARHESRAGCPPGTRRCGPGQ